MAELAPSGGGIRRVFMFGTERLRDLDPSKSPEEVLAMHAERGRPEFTNAVIEKAEVQDGRQVHQIVPSTGRRGTKAIARAQESVQTYNVHTSQGSRG